MIVWGMLPQKVPKYLRSAISHCTICAYCETTRLTPKRKAVGCKKIEYVSVAQQDRAFAS